MTRLFGIAFAAIICMALLARIAGSLGPQVAPAEDQREHVKASAAMVADAVVPGDGTVIRRDGTGQFHVPGRVNGAESRFLVDTGADIVALTVDTADAAGLNPDPARFEPILQTASGEGRGARYTVQNLEVAGHELHDVEVVVAEGLQTDLLGQSVLKRLGKVELRGDVMVIGGD